MEHPLIENCPSCGNHKQKPFLDLSDWFLSQEPFSLTKCENCTLVYTTSVPKNIGDYYKSDEYISHSEKKTLLSSVYKIVQRTTLKSKRRLIQQYSTGNSLLDYGAGKGDFASYMIKSGFEVSGFEPDSEARDLASKKNQINLIDSVDRIPDHSIDTITMWHVLEHIPNPNDIIQQLLRKLKKGGTLIIAVPNYNSFDGSHYGKYWAAYDVPRHVTHFVVESMRFLLKQHGLKIIQTKPMWFDSTYVSLLSEKYKALDSGHYPNILNQLKAVITGMMSNLVTVVNNNRCSSIIYVIQPE